MLSIRALSRSIPRLAARVSAASCRNSPSVIRRSSPLQSTWIKAATPRFAAAFSTSRQRLAKEGEVDDELAAKLASELQLEKEMRDPEELPVSVKDYLDNGPFQIQDTPGQEEVVLTRKYGDENIRVAFSISDLNNLDQESDKFEDRAMYDEEDEDEDGLPTDGQSGGAQSKSTVRSGRTKDGNINVARDNNRAPANRSELQDEDGPADEAESESEQEPSFPANLTITIEKPGGGALQVETVAQDGMIMIDSVSYYADASLARADSPEKEFARRDMYVGPPFGNLDEDLQVMLERYLDERGINTALALFVPDYVDYKEQKEYLRWLNNVKSFVEA